MRPHRLPRQSSEKAFESLYRCHLREIYGYALALLDSPADAEDATQATFLNAYRALERGERPQSPRSWLRAIALNVCREHFRRASRRPDEVSLDDDPGELVVDATGPTLGEVLRALSHLPFNQRAALVMREFEGRSLAEIAEQLDVTSSAVEALLFRARRGLREQLEASLGCAEAEQAISRQLDGGLSRSERAALRAHLRECPECASLARRLRAQRSALGSLALVPVPASLAWGKLAPASALGGVSTAGGTSLIAAGAVPVAVKVVCATGLAALAIGGGYVALGPHATRAAAQAGAPDARRGEVSAAGTALDAGGRARARSARIRPAITRGGGGSTFATGQIRGHARSTPSEASGRGASGKPTAGHARGSQRAANSPPAGRRNSRSGHSRRSESRHSGGNGKAGGSHAASKPRQRQSQASAGPSGATNSRAGQHEPVSAHASTLSPRRRAGNARP